MRHGKKFNHLGRTASHRKAMLSNMAASLIINKRITTTVAKAKALRQYVEPLITRSKTDTTQSRRTVFSYLQDKESSQVLFSEVAEKVADRPGGYTRIIKLGSRMGDNAEIAMIELVDFNDLYTQSEETTKRTRRSRRGGKRKSSGTEGTPPAASADTATAVETDADTASTDVAPADEVAAASVDATTQETTVSDEEVASTPILESAPAPEQDASAPEEDTHVVEVKDEGDVVELSGEAVVGEPVVVEETDETDTPPPTNEESTTDEDKDEDKK